MRPEVRSLRRAMSNSSQYVSLCKHSNLLLNVHYYYLQTHKCNQKELQSCYCLLIHKYNRYYRVLFVPYCYFPSHNCNHSCC